MQAFTNYLASWVGKANTTENFVQGEVAEIQNLTGPIFHGYAEILHEEKVFWVPLDSLKKSAKTTLPNDILEQANTVSDLFLQVTLKKGSTSDDVAKLQQPELFNLSDLERAKISTAEILVKLFEKPNKLVRMFLSGSNLDSQIKAIHTTIQTNELSGRDKIKCEQQFQSFKKFIEFCDQTGLRKAVIEYSQKHSDNKNLEDRLSLLLKMEPSWMQSNKLVSTINAQKKPLEYFFRILNLYDGLCPLPILMDDRVIVYVDELQDISSESTNKIMDFWARFLYLLHDAELIKQLLPKLKTIQNTENGINVADFVKVLFKDYAPISADRYCAKLSNEDEHEFYELFAQALDFCIKNEDIDLPRMKSIAYQYPKDLPLDKRLKILSAYHALKNGQEAYQIHRAVQCFVPKTPHTCSAENYVKITDLFFKMDPVLRELLVSKFGITSVPFIYPSDVKKLEQFFELLGGIQEEKRGPICDWLLSFNEKYSFHKDQSIPDFIEAIKATEFTRISFSDVSIMIKGKMEQKGFKSPSIIISLYKNQKLDFNMFTIELPNSCNICIEVTHALSEKSGRLVEL